MSRQPVCGIISGFRCDSSCGGRSGNVRRRYNLNVHGHLHRILTDVTRVVAIHNGDGIRLWIQFHKVRTICCNHKHYHHDLPIALPDVPHIQLAGNSFQPPPSSPRRAPRPSFRAEPPSSTRKRPVQWRSQSGSNWVMISSHARIDISDTLANQFWCVYPLPVQEMPAPPWRTTPCAGHARTCGSMPNNCHHWFCCI